MQFHRITDNPVYWTACPVSLGRDRFWRRQPHMCRHTEPGQPGCLTPTTIVRRAALFAIPLLLP